MTTDFETYISSSRRAPQQQRSKVTVESIKQATLELASESGFNAISTIQIAGRAGVSVGSLYQYFANREAIYVALYEDSTAALADTMKRVVIPVLDAPLEEGVGLVVRRLLRLYKENRPILIDLVTEMPELRLDELPLSFGNLIRGSIKLYLQRHARSSHRKQIDRLAFFSEHVILGCIKNYIMQPSESVSERAFVRDLTRIMVGYYSGELIDGVP